MTSEPLNPVIHVPARLRIVATLATLPDGDALSFIRLQDILDLTPGNLITHLRKLEDAGYVSTEKTGNGTAGKTTVALPPRPQGARRLHRGATRPARRSLGRPGMSDPRHRVGTVSRRWRAAAKEEVAPCGR